MSTGDNDRMLAKKKDMNGRQRSKSRSRSRLSKQTNEFKQNENGQKSQSNDVITICMLGKAGAGKSTTLNRLTGDTSTNGDHGQFKTGDAEKGVTRKVQAQQFQLNFSDSELQYLNGTNALLIDTPGLMDRNKDDKKIAEEIREFFKKTCGGINVIVLCFNVTVTRYDGYTSNLLNVFERMFKKQFWNHVLIVFNHVDMCNGVKCNEDLYKKKRIERPETLKKEFNLAGNIPCIDMGKGNYINGIKKIMELASSKPKYSCQYMQSWKYCGDDSNKQMQLLSTLRNEMGEMRKSYEGEIKKLDMQRQQEKEKLQKEVKDIEQQKLQMKKMETKFKDEKEKWEDKKSSLDKQSKGIFEMIGYTVDKVLPAFDCCVM